MIKLIQFIFALEPFEISFNTTIDVAVERLNSRVKKFPFYGRVTTPVMVGEVSEKSTKIVLITPMWKENSFRPLLVGSFKEKGDKTIFSGVFRFHRGVQIFSTLWFGFFAFWTSLRLVELITKQSKAWNLPFHGLLMISLEVGLIRLGMWASHDDKKWLIENISNAINGDL